MAEGKEDKINWKQVLITAFFALIVGIILFHYENRKGKIVYTVLENSSFAGGDINALIYSLDIENKGKIPIKDVKAVIEINDGCIQTYRYSVPRAIDRTISIIDCSLEITLPNFNQGELVYFQIYAIGDTNAPTVNVDIRGSGIIGTEKETITKYSSSNLRDLVLSVILGFLLALFIFSNKITL